MSASQDSQRTSTTARPRLWSATAPRAALVTRLTRPGLDPAKRRVRLRLLQLSDEQLRTGLGWSRADVEALRSAGRADGDLAAVRPVRELPALPLAA
ncbi:MAG: hypothetical protein WCK28_13295 [Burkholderiales bacterium]|jgi:hypothetical protein